MPGRRPSPRWLNCFAREDPLRPARDPCLADDHSGAHDPDFDTLSHGESFLALLSTRSDSPGLYCLDEPEAALSFSAQVALVGWLHELAASGAQALCATHSPLLAALPGAHLLEVGDWGSREVGYDELDPVRHWRSYSTSRALPAACPLRARQRPLRRALDGGNRPVPA